MPREWDEVIGQGAIYQPEDFKLAAYQLISNQILYESNNQQVFAYRLIDRYRNAFRETFDLLGMSLKFDSTYRYVAVIPYLEKQKNMSTADALLLLVLRKLYHIKALQGSLDSGSAVLPIDEFLESYRAETGRELPPEAGALKELLGRMKIFGVVKMPATEPGSDQPFDVEILPGIEAIVSEATLSRLTEYAGRPRRISVDNTTENEPTIDLAIEKGRHEEA